MGETALLEGPSSINYYRGHGRTQCYSMSEYDHSIDGPRVTLCDQESLNFGTIAIPTDKTEDAIDHAKKESEKDIDFNSTNPSLLKPSNGSVKVKAGEKPSQDNLGIEAETKVPHGGNQHPTPIKKTHLDTCSAGVFFLLTGKPGVDIDNRTRLCYMGDPLAPCAHVDVNGNLVFHLDKNALSCLKCRPKTLPKGAQENDHVTTTGPFGCINKHHILREAVECCDTDNMTCTYTCDPCQKATPDETPKDLVAWTQHVSKHVGLMNVHKNVTGSNRVTKKCNPE